MGLFDGRGDTGFASTAHVAELLAAPVVLVVDAARQSRSVAAVVHGFATFEPGVRIGGVILNRIGSDRHEELCRSALEATGVPVLGAIRRDDAVVTPSRHLGLIPAAERGRRPCGRWSGSVTWSAAPAIWTRCSGWRAPLPRSRGRRGTRPARSSR